MTAYYKHTNDMDLTLDDISLNPNEKIAEVPEHLIPTPAMIDFMYKNSVDLGLLEIIYK